MEKEFTKTQNETIASSASSYLQALKEIEERRQLWKVSAREKLMNALEHVRSVSNVPGIDIQLLKDCENLETINIGFKETMSGIVLTNGLSKSPIEKHGGRLCFAQAYNGKVFIVIIFPYIEGIVDQLENKLLSIHEPADLTHELIVDNFYKFMDEMTIWETHDRDPIGFTSK